MNGLFIFLLTIHTATAQGTYGTYETDVYVADLSVVFVHAGKEVILPPCQWEDSTNCYWDAGERGNGLGTSFYDIGGISYPFQP